MSSRPNSAAQCALSPDNTGYDAFATIYSRWIGADFARRALPAVEPLITSNVEPGTEVLDLCCGCGHIAARLVKLGFRVTGLDASPNMLHIARNRVPEADFVCADARAFSFPQSFAAVISTFNSFAHVRTEELEQVFRNVRDALGAGGVFLFDLTMQEAYLARWRGSFSTVADDHACVVRPTYDPIARLATNYVTAFEPEECGFWKRSDFVIVQHCHECQAVVAALARAGFDCVQMLDAQHDLGMSDESGRAFFLCK